MEILALEIGARTCGASVGGQEESIVEPRAGLDHRNAVEMREKMAPPSKVRLVVRGDWAGPILLVEA